MTWCALTRLVVTHVFELEQFEKHIGGLEEVTTLGSTPLFFAVVGDQVEIVQFLLDRGANPQAINIYGETPLHWAVLHNKVEFVRLLLAAGARPTHRDGELLTAVDWALEQEGHEEILLLLQQSTRRRRPSFRDLVRQRTGL
jgi:ankyrin repeat protein